jgi:hypothetical protein
VRVCVCVGVGECVGVLIRVRRYRKWGSWIRRVRGEREGLSEDSGIKISNLQIKYINHYIDCTV